MNGWFIAAALMSGLTLGIHLVAGGRYIVRPLLAAEGLGEGAKYTAYYCWHLVSIVLAGMALAFVRAGIAPGGRELAATCVLFATLAAVWSFAMVSRHKLPFWQYPQGLLFVLVVVPGAAGLWL
jgi:hypothetical protein